MEDNEKNGLGELDEWKARYESEPEDPRELFRQVSHIALCMTYDLVDKLRWWEKETMKLSNEEIEKRIPHMASFLDNLKAAYVQFSDVDL